VKLKSICWLMFFTITFLPAVTSPVWADASDVPLTTYQAKSGAFSLPLPSGWSVQEDSVIEGYKIPLIAYRPSTGAGDTFQDNMNVTLEPLPSGATASDYLVASIKVMAKSLTHMKVLKTGPLQGGFPGARYMIYTHQTGFPEKLQVVAFFFTSNSKGYVLSCTSTAVHFDKFFPLYWKVGRGFAPGK